MPGTASNESIKAVFFDVDGTLVDSIQMIVAGLGDMYQKFGGIRPSDSEIRSLIGTPLKKQIHLFNCSPKTEAEEQEMIDYTVERYRVHHHFESEFTEAVDSLILGSKAGIKTCAVTSKNSVELNDFLTTFRAADCFHATVCASDVTHPKPDAESAFRALELTQTLPHEAILIGDSIFDLRCARGAGIRSGAVLYGAGKADDLLAEAPDTVFETPSDLMLWVGNLIEQSNATEEKHHSRTDF